MSAPIRSRSVGTKVTEDEYHRLVAASQSRGLNLSEWSREALLRATVADLPTAAEQTLLAELLALRTIVGNLMYQLTSGDAKVSPEQFKEIIHRADSDKRKRAASVLAEAFGTTGNGAANVKAVSAGERGGSGVVAEH
jgi:hypothetical protein